MPLHPKRARELPVGAECIFSAGGMPAAGKICGRTAGGALDLSAGLCFIIHRVQFRGRRGDGGMVDNGTAGAGADCAGQQKRNRLARLQGRPGKVAGPRLPAFSAVQ